MSVRQISTSDWGPYLGKLAREHRAWLATVERNGLVEAREQPLESIEAARDIDIRLGGQSIRVHAPRRVQVEETAEGAAEALQIDDAGGARVTLRFRIALAPGALDGLAPAER